MYITFTLHLHWINVRCTSDLHHVYIAHNTHCICTGFALHLQYVYTLYIFRHLQYICIAFLHQLHSHAQYVNIAFTVPFPYTYATFTSHLHYITVTLHCMFITLHYITLQSCITLHYVTLHYVTLRYRTLHVHYVDITLTLHLK